MAFEGVSSKLQAIFKRLNGRGKLTEADVNEAMREIKLALLEADVNFLVVKDFIKIVSARAVGSEVLESLTRASRSSRSSTRSSRASWAAKTPSWTLARRNPRSS
jgi:signal recognition particle subunit SRP54